MKKTVSDTEAESNLAELLERVRAAGDEVIIEREGTMLAVIIPAERYESMERNREDLFAIMEQMHERTKDIPDEVIQDSIDEAIAYVRNTPTQPASV